MFRNIKGIGLLFIGSCLLMPPAVLAGDDGDFEIDTAKWDRERSRLVVKGKGEDNRTISVAFAASGELIASKDVDDGEWRIRKGNLAPVPCRVRVTQSDGQSAEKDVKYAPANCDEGLDPPPPPTANGDYTVLAANDLGMHCADTDYRIFSILPPYNVLNAQVIRKGAEPQIMTRADGISVTYRAATSNIVDPNNPTLPPIATNSITTTSQNNTFAGIYKGNFWQLDPNGDPLGFLAYNSLYPTGVLGMFPFQPDLGLPAPDVEDLYLGSGGLSAHQAAMPGITVPYAANVDQPFNGYVSEFPFFVSFPFGYTVPNFKRFTAEGIPVLATDDMGRTNPYPLMTVEAKDSNGEVLASVDTVVPVASEADCQICHAVQNVCSHDTTNTLICDDIANTNYDQVGFIEDAAGVVGDTPEQRVINAAKINILKLHDFKHPEATLAGTQADGSNADGTTPNVVCASCHYSPALDLAHLGPNDDNGKEQTQHISMSRAMHGVHGDLAQNNPDDYGHLFPSMPLPGQRTAEEQEQVLQESCYNCHPGKRTKCLRGAMSDGGVVCQDCHGQLSQVGDDFTENFPNIPFPLDGSADLTKRVPWASEPKCQSCHVGDVLQTRTLQNAGDLDDTLISANDLAGNPDGLRLKLAYAVSDHKDNGGGDNLTLLDFKESRFASNQALYRLSGGDDSSGKGHGGLSCEGCHGSTHAIWPNANPFANDNKAASSLQGHTGSIIECNTCHEGDLGDTLEGPHGMHPVGDTSFAREGHEDMVENNKDACRACHGLNGEGSVLARTATARVLESKEDQPDGSDVLRLPKGAVVTCTLCHENEL